MMINYISAGSLQRSKNTGLGFLGWLLFCISWLLVVITFPFSLCVLLKVTTSHLPLHLQTSSTKSLKGCPRFGREKVFVFEVIWWEVEWDWKPILGHFILSCLPAHLVRQTFNLIFPPCHAVMSTPCWQGRTKTKAKKTNQKGIPPPLFYNLYINISMTHILYIFEWLSDLKRHGNAD